jgi:aryl-alcohol dehydrogenase-like predicted oxidoreductase
MVPPLPNPAWANRASLGTLHLAGQTKGRAEAILDAWVDAGGRRVDTAAFYGRGDAEVLLGGWLRHAPSDVLVTTKIGYFPSSRLYRDAEHVIRAVHESCTRLGRIPDAVLLHEADWDCWWSDARAGVRLGAAPHEPCGAWQVLGELARTLGFAAGISGNHAATLTAVADCLEPSVLLVGKQYDLIWRSAASLLRPCVGRRVTLAAPFHQGALLDLPALAGDALRRGDHSMAAQVSSLQGLLGRHGVDVAHAALAWLLSTTSAEICFGAATVHEVRADVRAFETELPDELVGALSRLGLNRPARAGRAGPDGSVDLGRATVVESTNPGVLRR